MNYVCIDYFVGHFLNCRITWLGNMIASSTNCVYDHDRREYCAIAFMCMPPLAKNARQHSIRTVVQGKLPAGIASYPSPFSSDGQHLSYGGCREVRGEIIRTVLRCIVYWSCAVISTLRWAVLTVLWVGLWLTGPISLCLDSFVFMFVFLCLSCHTAYVLYYCNTVGWKWWNWSLILRTFLQCFDTVGEVIWPVKTRPRYDLGVWI